MGMQSRNNLGRLVVGLLLGILCAGVAAAGAQTAVVPLLGPSGLAFDGSGGVYVAEAGRHVVDRFDPATGKFVVVAGNGTEGFSGDGGVATSAELDGPQGVALDGAGNLYIADVRNQRVRRVDAGKGLISTVAGSGVAGFSGDQGAATAARLSQPVAVALDGAGNLFVADAGNHRVRRVVLATGVISTVAGNGTEGDAGDGGAATAASLDAPGGLAVDGLGNLWIADTHNHRVRKVVLATGVIEAGADGVGLPKGMSVDAAGNVYVADAAGHRVLRVMGGVATVVAGTGAEGFAGDGGAAGAALLDGPGATGVSPAGLVTLADTRNERVRQVDGAGVIRTLAGVGPVGALSLSGPAVVQYGVGTPVVASAAGATGSVTFYDVTGGTPVALGTVDGGGAAGLSTLLGVGNHTVTAVYGGDGNFLGSMSASLSEVVNPVSGVTADFALNPTSATQAVVGGASAAFGFGVAVTNGSLSGPIVLAATGLPTGATASFNPALIPPGGAVTSFTLTILTVKKAAVAPVRAAAVLLGMWVVWLPFGWRRRGRGRIMGLMVGLGLLAGCGDRVTSLATSSTGTVNYPITVTGTSTTASGAVLVHTAVVTLTVQ